MEQVDEWLLPVAVQAAAPPVSEPDAGVRQTFVLRFGQQQREEGKWNWIAVAASISSYFNPGEPWSQCEIAAQELGLQCCIQPRPNGCDESGLVADAMETAEVLDEEIAGRATFAQARAAILLQQPFGVGIVWQNRARHSVSVYGYAIYQGQGEQGAELLIGEPWPAIGDSWVPYATFPQNYLGGGAWAETGLSE